MNTVRKEVKYKRIYIHRKMNFKLNIKASLTKIKEKMETNPSFNKLCTNSAFFKYKTILLKIYTTIQY